MTDSNSQTMNITIVGAGGMGSRFGLMLHQAGNSVSLVDGWQANVDAIRTAGLVARYNGREVVDRLPIYSPQEAGQLRPQVIILFVKSQQLDAMLEAIRPLIGPDTYLLCLLNGLGHEDIIKKYAAEDHIILGVTMWTAGMTAPGHVTLFGDGNVELQNLRPGEAAETFTKRLVTVLDEAGLNAVYSENVKYSIWRKACVNGTMNCLCSLLECNIGQYGRTSAAAEVIRRIVCEFAAVAACEQVQLDMDEVVAHITATFTADIADHYPSMYQDLVVNHRPTEIDFIDGAVWRKGQRYGVPTPYCALLTQLIHGKEELGRIRQEDSAIPLPPSRTDD